MENSTELLKMLIEQEENAGRLYHIYQNIFPEEQIWGELIKEESNHATWLQALSQDPKAVFDSTRFSFEAVQSMLEYQKKLMAEAPKQDLTQALAISYDLENALIEKSFFENFKTDSVNLQKILNDLSNETKQHRTLIKERLDEVRKAKSE